MIEVKQLTKRYGNHLAVDGISFKAKSGEILGLLGPNGAGKSTTMRILTGFMPPTDGKASVAGYDVMDDSMEVRKRVGYMPERVPFYPDMTVEGYVMFWAKLRGVANPKPRVHEVLERVQIIDRRKSLIRSLSKGLKQRVGLAQALVHDPEVVILDEPTIGIDPQQVIEVREAVRELAENHTVLFSTHILSEAEQVCDRVIIINEGRIVAEGRPDALRKRLQNNEHIYVEIGGTKEAKIQKLLEQLPGVDTVELMGAGFEVYARKNVDVRPHIVEKVMESGYQLLELRPVAMTLEDIFLDIVGKGAK
jgi:ABC-2 type transport system ATP-binding protein